MLCNLSEAILAILFVADTNNFIYFAFICFFFFLLAIKKKETISSQLYFDVPILAKQN